MATLADLGNNNGHIIVLRPDNNTVVRSFANSIQGVKESINHALSSGAIVGNRAASGTMSVDDLTGAIGQSVTAININGVDQIAAPVTVGSTDIDVYATALRDAINAFTPASGPDYTASVLANVVNIIAPASVGDTVNGSAITPSFSGVDILTTQTDIDNGSVADSPQDKIFGNQYILNSAPGSEAGDIGSGIDITRFIVMRGMQTTLDTITGTVVVNALTFERTMVLMNIELTAGGPTTLDTINTADSVIGDRILVSGLDGAPTVTINETGNIELANGTDFVTGGPEVVIELKLTDLSGTLKWAEVARSPNIVISVATMRDAGIAQPGNGAREITMTGGAQAITTTAGVDSGYIRVTGAPSLTGAFSIDIPIGSPIDGDKMVVDYHALPGDSGGSVAIFGRFLPAAEFTQGKTRIEATYTGLWVVVKLQNSDEENWIVADDMTDNAVETVKINDLAVTTAKINNLAVTSAKLAVGAVSPNNSSTTMKRKMVSYPMSFETGELGTNQTIFMGGKGSIANVTFSPLTLIEATNDGAVGFFNNTQTFNMGSITVAAGSVRGAGITAWAPATTTFDDGDEIFISTSKITAGGTGIVTIVYDAAE